MIDEAPEISQAANGSQLEVHVGAVSDIPIKERDDGIVVIDILAPPPPAECQPDQPDPFQDEIVVCRNIGSDQRIENRSAESSEFAGAIPRAQVKLGENSVASVDGEARPVGNTPANAAMVNVRIRF